MRSLFILCIGLQWSLLTAVWAQVPQMITYQGRITAAGTNFSGDGHFKFALVGGSTNLARQAVASATVKGGSIYTISVVDGGSGYTDAPLVTVRDVVGSGAKVIATVSHGAVEAITVANGGSGYSQVPQVQVEAPKPVFSPITFWSHDGTSVTGSEPASAVVAPVSDGLFTIGLGDVNVANMTSLGATIFEQPDLRLRIWFSDGVGSFVRLSPDQPLGSVGYAMMAAQVSPAGVGTSALADQSILSAKIADGTIVNADIASDAGIADTKLGVIAQSGKVANSATTATSSNVVNAIVMRNGSGGFSAGQITASTFVGNGSSLSNLNASQLAAGVIPESRVPAVIARVSNIMPEVLANDGTGSNLNADLLDGQHAAAFATGSHTHAGMVTNTAASWVFIPGVNFGSAVNYDEIRMVPTVRGEIQLYSDIIGERSMTMPISLPSVLYGKPVRLDELWVDYRCEDGTKNYISGTGLTMRYGGSMMAGLLNDSIQHKSNDYTNYMCTELGTLSSNVWAVMLRLNFQFATKTNYVQLNGVRFKLTH
jgi:hypothetical protein